MFIPMEKIRRAFYYTIGVLGEILSTLLARDARKVWLRVRPRERIVLFKVHACHVRTQVLAYEILAPWCWTLSLSNVYQRLDRLLLPELSNNLRTEFISIINRSMQNYSIKIEYEVVKEARTVLYTVRSWLVVLWKELRIVLGQTL